MIVVVVILAVAILYLAYRVRTLTRLLATHAHAPVDLDTPLTALHTDILSRIETTDTRVEELSQPKVVHMTVVSGSVPMRVP